MQINPHLEISSEFPNVRFHPWHWLRQTWATNRPLTVLIIAMAVMLPVALVGLAADPRMITDAPAWLKPFKFIMSFGIYSVTLLWLLTFVTGRRLRRIAGVISALTAIASVIEVGLIAAQAARGVTSHFNFATPLDGTLFQIMGVSVVVIAAMNMITLIVLAVQKMSQRALAWSARLGLLISFVGMLSAALMLQPTAEQLRQAQVGNVQAMGAHSVGVADGGPGLPIVGWSTVGGDLRVAHFVGMHAMQLVPLAGWLISRRRRISEKRQVLLVVVTATAYLALVITLAWQAMRGQSVVAPDVATLAIEVAILFTFIGVGVAAVRWGRAS